MLATPQSLPHYIHPLARFVTPEAIALLLNCPIEKIDRIDCWRYVIHVVGKGISTFVSYADLPPIINVEPPNLKDMLRWRRRWRKNHYQAPHFWADFYAHKLKTARTPQELSHWKRLVHQIEFALPEIAVPC